MLNRFHVTRFSAIFVILVQGLVLLQVPCGLTWAAESSNHSHNRDNGTDPSEQADHTHAPENVVTLTNQAKMNIGLRTAEADVRAIEGVVGVHGNVVAHPGRQAIVTPRISGIVKNIHSNVGKSVKKGDVLIELESLELQLAQIELIAAVAQKRSLEAKLTGLTAGLAKQIRRELQTRQIDYLQSLSELQALKTAVEKRKMLAVAMITSTLEQMRFRLVKAGIEHELLKAALKRTEALAEKRISAEKELAAQRAAYKKGQNEWVAAKRQFQILGISEQTLEKILHEDGKTPILSLLGADTLGPEVLLEKYAALSGEGAALVDAETTYKTAAIQVAANKQRAVAAGLTENLLDSIAKTEAIVPFTDVPNDELITGYLAFMANSEALEGVLQLEEALRKAVITLNRVEQKLQVLGLTRADIDEIVQTGQPSPIFYVTAPASGQVTHQHVVLGTTVEKGRSLFSILDTGIVWIEGEMHGDIIAHIQGKWEIGSKIRARVSAYPEDIFTGKISHISAVMEPEERTIHYWAEVNNPTFKLKPGMFAEQTIVLEKGREVLSVPLEAVFEDGGSRYVFVEFGDAYTKEEVVVGAKDDQYIEIKEGVFQGDYVVVQGQHQLLRATANVPDALNAHGHPH